MKLLSLSIDYKIYVIVNVNTASIHAKLFVLWSSTVYTLVSLQTERLKRGYKLHSSAIMILFLSSLDSSEPKQEKGGRSETHRAKDEKKTCIRRTNVTIVVH